MSPLSQFTSPPHDPYQTFQEPQPPMSYFEHTQALIFSLSDTMASQFQIVQSQNFELKIDFNDLRIQNLEFRNQVCGQMNDLTCEMQSLKTQHLELREELKSHMHDMGTQHQQFQHQLESL